MIAALAALRRTQASGWLDPRGLALVQHLLARCSSSAGPEPVQQHPWSEAASGAPGCSGATAPAWPRLLPLGARCFASDR